MGIPFRVFSRPMLAWFFLLGVAIGDDASTGRNDSPWGLSCSAHSMYTTAQWFPKVSSAGVTWVRTFSDWNTIEPKPGQWNWSFADELVANADKNKIGLCGLFGYSPEWAHDPDAKGAAFPMKHLDDWAQYAGEVAARYKGRVPYWEVWNEPNGNFKGRYPDGQWDTANDYATLVAWAYDAVKKADPDAQVGITCASVDLPYLSSTIEAEAAMGHANDFDFVCIHPYETLGGINEADGEIPYLWMAQMTRQVLQKDAPARANADIWITETGRPIGDKKESQEPDLVTPELSAETLVKAYVMGIAQGIKRICWFEGQAPKEESPAYGILDLQGKPRPAFTALQTLISYLGESPKYVGWLAVGKEGRGYGFVFDGPKGPVLVAWMPADMTSPLLSSNQQAIAGQVVPIVPGAATAPAQGGQNRINDSPVLLPNLPVELVTEAAANKNKNFPWGGDFSHAATASIVLGPRNDNEGIIQVERNWTRAHTFTDGSTGAVVSTPAKHDWQNIKFMTHPSFSNVMTRAYDVRVTARRLTAPKSPGSYAGMNLVYERADSQGGNSFRTAEWNGLDLKDAGWQTFTWHIKDAAFAKMWGYDFAFSIGESVPFVIGKVELIPAEN